MSEIEEKINKYLMQLSPHIKQREAAKLLTEAASEIRAFEECLREQRKRLMFFCEGTDGSTPAITTICRLREEVEKWKQVANDAAIASTKTEACKIIDEALSG